MSRVENEYSNYCANDKCRKPISDMVFYCSRECRDEENRAIATKKNRIEREKGRRRKVRRKRTKQSRRKNRK